MSTTPNLAELTPHPRHAPLEPGDHLAAAEFERRYAIMPPGTKAELIEGRSYERISGMVCRSI